MRAPHWHRPPHDLEPEYVTGWRALASHMAASFNAASSPVFSTFTRTLVLYERNVARMRAGEAACPEWRERMRVVLRHGAYLLGLVRHERLAVLDDGADEELLALLTPRQPDERRQRIRPPAPLDWTGEMNG